MHFIKSIIDLNSSFVILNILAKSQIVDRYSSALVLSTVRINKDQNMNLYDSFKLSPTLYLSAASSIVRYFMNDFAASNLVLILLTKTSHT